MSDRPGDPASLPVETPDAIATRPRPPSSPAPEIASPTPAVGHPPGTLIDRYVVVKPIARGGMGAVMLAYDTALARSVALKVVLTSVASPETRERMLREAQAMARLSHPNVVGIYDVGVHDGDVFLAMEYIDGVTLRDWLKQPRSRREVLAVMKQAGRGLAAAHKAGIVHRDFKPMNVIVARDGRVCVLDFGIARGLGQGEPSPSAGTIPVQPPGQQPLLDHTITLEGSLMGTPGYAAPEVLLGLEVDPRADVFSFSVTLWRALYGTLPFPSGLEEYLSAVCGTAPVRTPVSNVPHWLRDVVMRGLEREKGARFESMAEMLAALDANPWKKRIAAATSALVIAAAASAVLAKIHHDGAVRAECRAEGDAVAASWGPVSRESTRRALVAETDAFAAERSERTLERLDDYARAWAAEQTGSCMASRVAKTQPEAVHEKRTQCLLERRTQLEIVAELLASDDHNAHRQSLGAVNSLPAPRLCTAAAAERMSLALPAEPAARAKMLAARREILRAEVLRMSGDLAEAQRLAEHVVTVARDAGDGQLEARGEDILGRVLGRRYEIEGALQHERRAVSRAESVGADHIGGMAAAAAAFLLVNRMDREEEARAWLDLAHGKLARLGSDETLELEVVLNEVAMDEEKHPRRALETNARAIDLTRKIDGELHTTYCDQLANRAIIFDALGDATSAENWYRQGIDCQIQATGPHDPLLSVGYGNVAADEIALGHWDDALAFARRATELRAALDPKNPMLVWLFATEALALDGAHRYAEAEREAQRAMDLASGNPGDLALALFAFGLARAGQGDARGAKAACERALEPDSPDDPAKAYYEDVLTCLGDAELAVGDVGAARGHLARSVALPQRLSPGELAIARFALARALAAKGPHGRPAPDVARARSLAIQARDDLRGVVETHPFRQPWLDEIEHWLAAH